MSGSPGFTLIELVVVIVLTGIIGVVGANLIGDFVGGYVTSTQRQELTSSGRIAVERATRELRRAVPNSVKCPGGSCSQLVFLRASTGGRYQTTGPTASRLQINNNGDTFLTFGLEGIAEDQDVVVYPQDDTDVFGDSTQSAKRRARIASGGVSDLGTGNKVKHQVTLNTNDSLPRRSPRRRIFGVEDAVSLCCEGNQLLLGEHPLPGDGQLATSTTTFCNRSDKTYLLADNVSQCRFTYQPASLTRAAIVRIFLEVESPESDETVNFQQEVQVRNVP